MMPCSFVWKLLSRESHAVPTQYIILMHDLHRLDGEAVVMGGEDADRWRGY